MLALSLWRQVILPKLKTEILYNPVILLSGIYSKKTRVLIQKGISTSISIAALLIIAKIWGTKEQKAVVIYQKCKSPDYT